MSVADTLTLRSISPTVIAEVNYTLVVGFPTDVRHALRRLAATPLFTLFAVASLAVGVGVTTAIYSVVDSMFFKDFGVPDPDSLAFVVTPYDGRLLKGSVSDPDFDDLRAAQRSFSSLSASWTFDAAVTLPATTELLSVEAVDGAYFTTMRVGATIGRVLQPADAAAGANVVVLNDALWRRRFGANAAIIGQTLRIDGRQFEIVGVAATRFGGANGPVPGTKVWIPVKAEGLLASRARPPSPRDLRRLRVFGRLSPAVSAAAASAEIAGIAANLDERYPAPARNRHPGATERPWKVKSATEITGEDNFVHRFGFILIGLVALVLVVACTNLANLVLARGTARQQEIAMRYALGAPRWRLVREQCTESLLLAVAGGAASVLVFLGLAAVMNVEFNLSLPEGGRWLLSIQPQLDLTVAALAVGSVLASVLVFGLEPALHLTRATDLSGGLAVGAGRPTARRQRTLLRWQVAVSAGFFILATMFVKYTIAEASHDSGVEIDRVAVAVLNVHAQQWDEARVRRTLHRLLDEARNEPGITAISASTGMPFGTPGTIRLTLSLQSEPAANAAAIRRVTGVGVTPSFFSTAGVPILRGRGFDERDHSAAAPVVIVSEFTARTLFATAEAVGRQVLVDGRLPAATIVGVARDTDVGMILGDPHPFVYLPLAQRVELFQTIAARSAGDTASAVRGLRNILRRADPELAIVSMGDGRAVLSGPFVFLRAAGVAALALGAATLLLAMAGLFGVQSSLVTLRTREIGVRMSLGATAGRIKRMVLQDGTRPVLEGLALGLFGGIVGRAIVRAYMEIDTALLDPWMVAVVPVPLILAGLCACYLPARRAAAVDPNVALKQL